jgi:hypothetical protein
LTAEDESIEYLCRRIRALGHDEVAEVGHVPAGVYLHWHGLHSAKIVITGPQRNHLLLEHPEMEPLIPELLRALRDPDEIHVDRDYESSATFWRALDTEGRRWIRATVSLATPDKDVHRDSSLITARKSRQRDYLRALREGRRIWVKEKE